jgi:ABC-2 type transport system permease protein
MADILAALRAELLKVRRSRLPWVTVAAFAVAALVGGLFMFILQDQSRARSMGLLGTKAQFAGGTADWPSYFALLAQTVAVGGTVVYGLVMIWLFGREFSDGTAKDLLALPTARESIVAAKFAVSAVWCLLLAVQAYLLGLLIGWWLHLPGWSAPVAARGFGRLVATAVMVVLLVTLFGLAASIGRGYLVAVGCMLVAVFLAQVVAILGYGHLFPLSVPAIYSGMAGPDRPRAGPPGFVLVALSGIAGVAGTTAWWRYADQNR